jgi:hypothetical protein
VVGRNSPVLCAGGVLFPEATNTYVLKFTKMPTSYCEFCGKEWSYTSAAMNRTKRGGHVRHCKKYKTHSSDSTFPSHSGYKSETKANYQFQNYEGELLEDDFTSDKMEQCVSLNVLTVHASELEPCLDYYILQLAFMSKIDNRSNKTMKIGTEVGSNSSQRGQGNWKDYIKSIVVPPAGRLRKFCVPYNINYCN